MPVREVVEFVLFGIAVGAYGTMVGAGGGFVIVPILLLVYHFSPQKAAGTSLAVVLCNAVSATAAFVRQRRIDFRTGLGFAAATIPTAYAGGYVASYFSSSAFKGLFGALLIGLAVFLNLRPDTAKARALALSEGPLPPGYVRRTLVDARGERFDYAFNFRNGVILSFFIGFLSSILGVGGGIFLVPAMVFLFGFPAHLATATSTFVLMFTALSGSISHFTRGNIVFGPALAMAAGVIVGAQVGAAIAQRVKGRSLVRFLSIALVLAGLQLIYKAFTG
jgi:uncharacterized membrane protein YfcA